MQGPAEGVAEDAISRAMTAGLAFPIVYQGLLLVALQACVHINDVTLRQWELTTHHLSVPVTHPKRPPAPKRLTSAHEVLIVIQ